MGRLNKSGKISDKESYKYYTQHYNAMKSNYKKKGWVELIPTKMNKDEWEYKHNQSGISNSEIIYNEFHKYSKEAVENLWSKFKDQYSEKSKIPKGIYKMHVLARYSRGDLTEDEKKILMDEYQNKKKILMDQGIEHASALAASELHLEYWGS